MSGIFVKRALTCVCLFRASQEKEFELDEPTNEEVGQMV